MKPVSLSLKKCGTRLSQEATTGWLPSPSPEVWLTEVTRLQKDGISQTPGIIPITLDGITHGALLLLPSGSKALFGRRVSPLVPLLPNVLSLQNATLSTGLLEQEIRFSTFPGSLYFFLPDLGLIALNRESVLAPKDLVLLEASTFTWNHALPAPLLSPSLGPIILNLPGADDLELQADNIGDLQGKKTKGKGPLDSLKKGLGFGLGGLAAGPILGLGKIIGMLPDGPNSNSPSAFDKLEAWAQKHWKEITDARQRELNRLMELMDKNPEEGLRYALPLGGAESGRGKAPSGWTLGARNLRLGNNQGGGAVDGWDMDYQTQLKLEQQYRQAATTALAEGNYERAAYIYGELLNDWSNAAQALIKAGRLREAVSIFLHKLSDKKRAAQALEEAGLHLQAAEMYLEIGEIEKSADLYNSLGQTTRARELWGLATEKEKSPLEKARIFDSKLEEPTKAIAILDQAWRANTQPAAALRAEFQLLLKNDDSESVENLVTEFTAAPPAILPNLEKARLCLSFKEEILPPRFHPTLEETVLRLTSQQLEQSPSAKPGHQLLKILKQFRKFDELLSRDTRRFITGSKTIKITASKRKRGHITPTFQLGIPQAGHWQSLASLGENVSVAGTNGPCLVVAQLQGRSCIGSELPTKDFPSGNRGVFHLGLNANPHKARVFHFREGRKIHFRSLNTKRSAVHNALGSHQKTLAIGQVGAESFMLLQYHRTGSLVVDQYLANGTKLLSTVLDIVPPEMANPRWFCAGRDQHACFSAEHFAAWRYPSGELASCQLKEPLNKLTLSPGSHPLHALISSQHEAALLSPSKNEKKPEFVNLAVDDGTHALTSTFANNGDAIIASGYRGEIFSPRQLGEPLSTFNFPSELGHAIDIAPRGVLGFVILTSKGRLVLFD